MSLLISIFVLGFSLHGGSVCFLIPIVLLWFCFHGGSVCWFQSCFCQWMYIFELHRWIVFVHRLHRLLLFLSLTDSLFSCNDYFCVDGKTPSPWSHTRNRMQTLKINISHL
jgi:hypothetical protein